jgi:hypothetical protein
LSKKTVKRVIASGNHILACVKNNQPTLRARLQEATARLSPDASDETRVEGRNRWESRRLQVFSAGDAIGDLAWKPLIGTVLRLERTVHRRVPTSARLARSKEIAFFVSSACGLPASSWNAFIRNHWRIENSSHYVRDTTFGEDASRIRKNPDIAARLRSFAYNLLRAQGWHDIRNARYRAALDFSIILKIPAIA